MTIAAPPAAETDWSRYERCRTCGADARRACWAGETTAYGRATKPRPCRGRACTPDWARYERCDRCKAAAGDACVDGRFTPLTIRTGGASVITKRKPCQGRKRVAR